MRGFIFHTTAAVLGFSIRATQFVSNVVLTSLGSVGYFLLRLIDKNRLAGYQALLQQTEEPEVTDLQTQQTELNLLSTAAQLRDHARENGGWGPDHEYALNAIGDALLNQLFWEEEAVHQYLKEIVESIDGYEYGDLLE